MGERTVGNEFAKALIDAGIVPPRTRKVVIVAEAGCAVRVLYETFGTERLLDPELLAGLKDAEVVDVAS